MTDITQPEAIRLAHELDAYHTAPHHKMAAAELRRLQAMTADQAKALSVTEYVFSERNRLEAQRDELLAALKDAAHALEDEGRHYAAGVARAAIAKATGEKHTTDRELMQQALEGLEAAYEGQIWLSHLPDLSTALRERLAQPEQEPLDVGQLEYFGNSVAYIHQKMTAYRNSIDAAWDALRSKGIHPDGNTSVADAIAKYTTPPQRKKLPPQTPCLLTQAENKMFRFGWLECEAAHGIKGEA